MATPIFVLTSTGRTGTTLLMALLNQHPNIVLEDDYPYETRILQNEIYAEGGTSDPGLRGGDAMSRYAELSGNQGKTTEFVVEKLLGLNVYPIMQAYGHGRFLATIRDPRDVLMSITAFDAKRGFRGFALQDNDDSLSAIMKIGGAYRELVAVLEENKSICLVRYEDLLSDRQGVLDRVAECIGAASFPFCDAPVHAHHRTSATDFLSVGRWRAEMTEEMKALCWLHWQDVLTYFDYTQ